MESIKKFIEASYGSGYGSGDGSGSGFGSGFGDGSGFGFGFGSGFGYGSGFGSGSGSGSGYGSGSGSGYGDGSGSGSGSGGDGGYSDGSGYGDGSCDGGYSDGSGDGDGYGSGIKAYNGQKVYMVDDVETIITAAFGSIAKGYIINSDLTLTRTYIAKSEEKGLFAHGESIQAAINALSDKIFDDMDEDERISEFIKAHGKDIAYPASDLFEWHHKLTGSCEQGRSTFVKSHNISMDKLYTVQEFCEICENSYGGEIIRKLKERYNVKS